MFDELSERQVAMVEEALISYKHRGRGDDISGEVDQLLEHL